MICPAPMPKIREKPKRHPMAWRVNWADDGDTEWSKVCCRTQSAALATYFQFKALKRHVQLVDECGKVVAI